MDTRVIFQLKLMEMQIELQIELFFNIIEN